MVDDKPDDIQNPPAVAEAQVLIDEAAAARRANATRPSTDVTLPEMSKALESSSRRKKNNKKKPSSNTTTTPTSETAASLIGSSKKRILPITENMKVIEERAKRTRKDSGEEKESEERDKPRDEEVPIGVVKEDALTKRIAVATLDMYGVIAVQPLNLSASYKPVSVDPESEKWPSGTPRRVKTFEELTNMVVLNTGIGCASLDNLKDYVLRQMAETNVSMVDKLGWIDSNDINTNPWIGQVYPMMEKLKLGWMDREDIDTNQWIDQVRSMMEKFGQLSVIARCRVGSAVAMMEKIEEECKLTRDQWQKVSEMFQAAEDEKTEEGCVRMMLEARRESFRATGNMVQRTLVARRAGFHAKPKLPSLPDAELIKLGFQRDGNGDFDPASAMYLYEYLRDVRRRDMSRSHDETDHES